MLDPYSAFRQFERLLFRGVPEQPDSVWERDSSSLIDERRSGQSQLAEDDSVAHPDDVLIATIHCDRAARVLSVTYPSSRTTKK